MFRENMIPYFTQTRKYLLNREKEREKNCNDWNYGLLNGPFLKCLPGLNHIPN
jgi:hypothetical protein